MKRILITIILAGLLLLMMPIVVSADLGVAVTDRTEEDGVWEGNIWKVEMFPGETKSTTLVLRNSSRSSLGVEVSITPNSLDNGNLVFELDKANFTMPGRSYTNVTLTIETNGSASPGTYATELTIKSEVPPAPSPSYPQPTPLEPEEEEPIEPEGPVEPEEPTPEEPEEPVLEPEEPTEPEEPIEPIEPIEPVEPVEPEDLIPIEEPCRWSLLDSILASLVAIMLGLDIWQWRKKRA